MKAEIVGVSPVEQCYYNCVKFKSWVVQKHNALPASLKILEAGIALNLLCNISGFLIERQFLNSCISYRKTFLPCLVFDYAPSILRRAAKISLVYAVGYVFYDAWQKSK